MARTISLTEFANYRDLLSKINKKAADEFRDAVFNANGRFGGVGLGQIPRDDLINYAYGLVTKYGEASAAASCEMYDAIASLSNANVEPAVPADTAEYSDVAKTINGVLKQSSNENMLVNSVTRLVKRAGADTMLQNAYRDRKPSKSGKNSRHKHSGAQVAWVPSGDTCPFCIMLASRGWQQQSKWAADNHAEHIHANCDCVYMVRFDNSGGVAGYDPDKYLDMYRNAEGETRSEKLNSIRRMQYQDPETRAKINAQKREAYALMNESARLRNNLPKDFIDTRTVGNPISKKDLDTIKTIAENGGIQLGRDGSNIEFDSYCGNPQILKTVVEQAVKSKRELGFDKLILEYDNVLGYEGDNSKIDVGAFAETKKNTIRLNKFMFDDSKYLVDQYNQAVSEHIFASGTTYKNVIDHESGHILYRTRRELYVNAINALKDMADNANISLEDYIKANVSIYAGLEGKDGIFTELLPELNSMAHGSEPDLARNLLERRNGK